MGQCLPSDDGETSSRRRATWVVAHFSVKVAVLAAVENGRRNNTLPVLNDATWRALLRIYEAICFPSFELVLVVLEVPAEPGHAAVFAISAPILGPSRFFGDTLVFLLYFLAQQQARTRPIHRLPCRPTPRLRETGFALALLDDAPRECRSRFLLSRLGAMSTCCGLQDTPACT